MSIMNATQADQVRQRLQAGLTDDITIRLFVDAAGGRVAGGRERETSETARQLLEEVAALDPRIHLHVHDTASDATAARAPDIDHLPAVLISRNSETNLRYYGAPSGFEFAAFLDDLVAVSRGDSGLAAQTRAALAGLTRDVHVQVFVTPTCPFCPRASRMAHAFAQESPRIRADVIEANEFPHLAAKYDVYGVPRTVINETGGFEGAQPEAAFLAQILRAA